MLYKSTDSQYVAIFSHGGVLAFCFICNICFIRIAILCAWVSRRFKPPSFFERKMVFLAICSCLLFQRYLNIFSWIIKVVCKSIGKVLLRNEVFDNVSVFIICTFPFKESILCDSLFIWWFIFSIILVQFSEFGSCRSSLNCVPSILVVSYLCFIWICFGNFEIWSVLIGSTVVFSWFIVDPVAFCSFLKK